MARQATNASDGKYAALNILNKLRSINTAGKGIQTEVDELVKAGYVQSGITLMEGLSAIQDGMKLIMLELLAIGVGVAERYDSLPDYFTETLAKLPDIDAEKDPEKRRAAQDEAWNTAIQAASQETGIPVEELNKIRDNPRYVPEQLRV